MIQEIFSSAELFWGVYGGAIATMLTSIVAILTTCSKVKSIFANNDKMRTELVELRKSNKELAKEVKSLKEEVTRVKE